MARGFSLVELIVAMALAAAVIAGAVALVGRSRDVFAVQNELADMQQRLRVAIESLTRDLVAARTSEDDDVAIRPYRALGSVTDPPGTMRSDVVTVAGVDADGARSIVTYWLKSDDTNKVYQLMSST